MKGEEMLSEIDQRIVEIATIENFSIDDLYEIYGLVAATRNSATNILRGELDEILADSPTTKTELAIAAAKIRGLIRAEITGSKAGVGLNIIEVDSALLPRFELSDVDAAKAQKLCASLRALISQSSDFDADHKNRLLKRIGAIEFELNRSKGLLSIVLGAISEVGETVGKFGNDVKPITDRLNDLKRITKEASDENETKAIAPPNENLGLPSPDVQNEAEE